MLAIAVTVAAAAASPSPKPARPPAKGPIVIVINGNQLPIDPPPRLEKGLLLVPVRRTLTALGLPWDRSGSRVTTQVGAKSVTLTAGSAVAEIDGSREQLDAPAQDIKGTLYAPLRFFTDVLGAQARFDPRMKTVTIVSQLVGRADSSLQATGSGYVRVGTVSAVDVLSDPPSLTFGYDSGPKVVKVAPNATIDMQDVDANVTTPGELGDIRPGDFARVEMSKDGRVVRIVDEYGSSGGTIVAVAANQFVLDNGRVVTGGRTTEVSLNGQGVGFGDLRAGDRVTIRYNVETNEVREVLASRRTAATAASTQLAVSANVGGTLRPGDTVDVTIRGPAGGSATFGIGSYVSNQAMHEASPGVYAGSYRIPRGANFDQAPIVGQVVLRDGTTLSAQAAQTISVSSVPPGIVDFAPDNGAVVNDDRPAIYATFASDGLPVSPANTAVWINGRDVTGDCMRTVQFVHCVPSFGYPNGPVHVTVRVADRAGNATTRSWTFTVKAH